MGIRFWAKKREQPEVIRQAGGMGNPITHRAFLKTLVAAVGGAVVAPFVAPHAAEATYTTGVGGDTVDTNLTVQGNLIVGPSGTGSMGVGTANPQGKLHVAGDVWVGGRPVIGVDGVVKECYYAQ